MNVLRAISIPFLLVAVILMTISLFSGNRDLNLLGVLLSIPGHILNIIVSIKHKREREENAPEKIIRGTGNGMVQITSEYTGKRNRVYQIFIDDICCGEMGSNETKYFDVEKGRHIIYTKTRWGRSNDLHINVDNALIELEVGLNPCTAGDNDPGFGVLGLVFAVVSVLVETSSRRDYLLLQRKKTGYQVGSFQEDMYHGQNH